MLENSNPDSRSVGDVAQEKQSSIGHVDSIEDGSIVGGPGVVVWGTAQRRAALGPDTLRRRGINSG